MSTHSQLASEIFLCSSTWSTLIVTSVFSPETGRRCSTARGPHWANTGGPRSSESRTRYSWFSLSSHTTMRLLLDARLIIFAFLLFLFLERREAKNKPDREMLAAWHTELGVSVLILSHFSISFLIVSRWRWGRQTSEHLHTFYRIGTASVSTVSDSVLHNERAF